LRELGLSLSGLGEIPNDVKIGNIIVYCVGGACLSEEANLSKFESRIIYSGDKMINYEDLLGMPKKWMINQYQNNSILYK